MKTLEKLRAVGIAIILVVMMAAAGVGRATASEPKANNAGSDELAPRLEPAPMEIEPVAEMEKTQQEYEAEAAAEYAVWLENEQRQAAEAMANVGRTMTTAVQFTRHDIEAMDQSLPPNDGNGSILYLNQETGVTIAQGFLVRLGAGFGHTYLPGDNIESGVLWNPGSEPTSVTLQDGSVIDVNSDSLVVIGNIITNVDTAHENAGGASSRRGCKVTCGNGYYACCKDNGDSAPTCRCVQVSAPRTDCPSGGPGSVSCEISSQPNTGNLYEPSVPSEQ